MPSEKKDRPRLRARWIVLALIVVALSPRALRGCGELDEVEEQDFLVVVESSLAEPLRASLERYAQDMQSVGIEVHVEPFVLPGSVEALKALIFEYIDDQRIEGALLVGNLPAAWYEQVAFSRDEEFPMDLYLQDRDAIWTDEDENGVFDGHSKLRLDIYTARLHGTAEELVEYFARVHSYRWNGPLTDVSAFIFIDDDWATRVNTDDGLRLSQLYSNVVVCKEPYESSAEAYVEKMTGDGAEFVYQLAHSYVSWVQIEHHPEGGESTCLKIKASSIRALNFKGSFYNLGNCSAARFTEETNGQIDYIARDYILGTDYGLAAIGSTKTGAVINSRVFHGELVVGRSWGEAYQRWFNEIGYTRDDWHLGVVLLGDPLLRVSAHTDSWAPEAMPVMALPSEIEDIDEVMERIAAEAELGTYEEYRERHPEFFD